MTTWDDFTATGARWQTWVLMAQQDISLRYKGSVLGPFWISIALGITALGVGLLYATVFDQDPAEYIRFLAVGLMAWQFLSALILEGNAIVVEATNHLRSVAIPLPMLAARMVFRNLIVMLHNGAIVVAIILLAHGPLGWVSLTALGGVAMLALIGYFLAIALGPFCARYRDVPQIFSSALQLMFLMTPVFWRPEEITSRPWIRDWNPFYHLIELIRAPLFGQQMASGLNWGASFGILVLCALLAAISLPLTRNRVSLWV